MKTKRSLMAAKLVVGGDAGGYNKERKVAERRL